MHHIRSRKSRAGDENSHEIYVEISAAGSPSSCAGDDVVDRLRRSDVIVHVTSPGDVCSSTIRFSSCLIAFLPRDAMLSRYMLSSCVRLSQACIVSKHQLDESSWGLVCKCKCKCKSIFLTWLKQPKLLRSPRIRSKEN